MHNILSPLVDNIMLPFLKFSYEYIIPNYGVAIILLTLIVKAAFYPLTKKQFQSMKDMQKVQPKLKKLQEKYKNQPEKLQKEMMSFYKENNVNPFGGCLPLLIQLPIFVAIFYTIRSDAFSQIIAQPGINPGLFPSFWLTDLSQPDKFFILPIIIGIATYLSQKMTMTDPKQAKMMMFMPVFMVFICFKMPSGVLIYWAASQLISTVQQIMIMKKTT